MWFKVKVFTLWNKEYSIYLFLPSCIPSSLPFFLRFIYLLERERERGRSWFTDHSPNGHIQLGWGCTQGKRTPFASAAWVAGTQVLGPSFTVAQCTLEEAGWEAEWLGFNAALQYGVFVSKATAQPIAPNRDFYFLLQTFFLLLLSFY